MANMDHLSICFSSLMLCCCEMLSLFPQWNNFIFCSLVFSPRTADVLQMIYRDCFLHLFCFEGFFPVSTVSVDA